MSKNFDDIAKNIMKNNKELHNVESIISKEIDNLQKSIKKIELKINSMDETLIKLFDILNNITIFLEEAEESEPELDDEEDWTPYDERNFTYEDDSSDDYENYENN
jgi:septal ring factor EnvC (AmiA/AmiB activator)